MKRRKTCNKYDKNLIEEQKEVRQSDSTNEKEIVGKALSGLLVASAMCGDYSYNGGKLC